MQIEYRPSQNPYWSKLHSLQLESPNVRLDTGTEAQAGRWLAHLGTPGLRTVNVEIGCNGGHWLLGQAMKNPSDLWIGIDYKFKQVYLGHEKAKKRNLMSNTVLLRANALRLPHVFGTGEIDRLFLFFPDPWPKDRHQKHRLFSESWLRAVHPLLKSTGRFEIRTDHPDYFREMLGVVNQVKDLYTIDEVDHDLYAERPEALKLEIPDVTLFERVFIREGKPIQRMVLHPWAGSRRPASTTF